MHLNYFCPSVLLLYDTKSPDIVFIFLVVTRRVWGLTSEIGKKWSFIQPVLLIKQHVRRIFLKLGAVTFLKKDKATEHWSERQQLGSITSHGPEKEPVRLVRPLEIEPSKQSHASFTVTWSHQSLALRWFYLTVKRWKTMLYRLAFV